MKPSLPILLLLLLSLLLLSLLLPALSPASGGDGPPPLLRDALRNGPYQVGFRLLEETDRSRAIRAGGPTAAVHPRPVRVYLWYPARPPEGAGPMSFGRYAELADEDVWPEEILPGARERMTFARRPFARSLGEERYGSLLKEAVTAFEGAPPRSGPFPLIVVGQGLYYESPVTHARLCELLASYGFVVATTPLVGAHSPLVHLDVADLEAQVRDMELAIARARAEPFVSPGSLGLFGFDMGGMSCVVLAMRNADVDAFVSVDAGILWGHAAAIPSGIPFTASGFDPGSLRAPWLHATQRRFGTPHPGEEGASLFDAALHSDRYLALLDGMRHVDFTSYALVEGRAPMLAYWPPEQGGEGERYQALLLYVSHFFRAYLAVEEESRGFLSRDPRETVPGVPLTIEHRPATPPGADYSDFRNALLAGDSEKALSLAARIRAHRPDSPLFEETVLIRLGYHLISSWEMKEEGLAVFRLNAELHPDSANAWDSLGDGYLWSEREEQAVGAFRRVLELDPANEKAMRILENLESTAPSE